MMDWEVYAIVHCGGERWLSFQTSNGSSTDRCQHAIGEVFRILRPSGFLQFSISHPCFDTPHCVNPRNQQGDTYAFEIGDDFRNQDEEISEWLFSAAPHGVVAGLRPFRASRFTRTLSQWFAMLIRHGFSIEYVAEPRPSSDDGRRYPTIQDTQVVADFLHIRARKPGWEL